MISSPRRRRGLTFLEIMVVVTIMGILIAIALPAMRGPQESAALRSTSRDLVAAGLMARQTAIVEGHPTYLMFWPKDRRWRMHLSPPEKQRFTWAKEERTPTTSDEQQRTLAQHISFVQLRRGDEKLEVSDRDDVVELAFYPNGSSNGLAVEVTNTRNKTLTIEFDPSTGRPEVYQGEPKTMAQKLREQGIDPAAYGLADADAPGGDAPRAGSGFSRTAGMNEDERVKYYEDAVQRMLEKSRNKYRTENEGGPAAVYRDAAAWGGRR